MTDKECAELKKTIDSRMQLEKMTEKDHWVLMEDMEKHALHFTR